MSNQERLFEVEEFPVVENVSYTDPKQVPSVVIKEVFDFWVELHRTSARGRRPVLDDKRRRLIAKAVVSHGPEACKDAIRGCLASSFHQGKNDRGRKYDSLELILRDTAKIESFCRLWDEAKTGGGFLDED